MAKKKKGAKRSGKLCVKGSCCPNIHVYTHMVAGKKADQYQKVQTSDGKVHRIKLSGKLAKVPTWEIRVGNTVYAKKIKSAAALTKRLAAARNSALKRGCAAPDVKMHSRQKLLSA